MDIGRSALGRPITALHFAPPSYARPRAPAVLFAAIHGDEPAGIHCLAMLAAELCARPPGRNTWIIPVTNPDGVFAGTKNNANDVDLNRNFAATSWTPDHDPGYFPGPSPESELETQALVALIERVGARRFVSLHQPFRTVNWDGSGRDLAEAMAAENGYGASEDLGYPTPGSFGAKYGADLGLEVVTLEIPLVEDEEAWRENRAALRLAVDLPA